MQTSFQRAFDSGIDLHNWSQLGFHLMNNGSYSPLVDALPLSITDKTYKSKDSLEDHNGHELGDKRHDTLQWQDCLHDLSWKLEAWSMMDHTFECNIVPMAQAEEILPQWMDLRPSKANSTATLERGLVQSGWGKHELKEKLFHSLEMITKEVGIGNISAVVITYISHKIPYVSPVIGRLKVKQVFASIKGLEICLSPEQISYLESAVAHEPARLPDGDMFASHSHSDVTGQIDMHHRNAHHFTTKLFKPGG
ncbi:hypothetical protein J3R82DRAFT_2777 [Butyriboletus roseoflavus]|nr:hypothetical protein J3R82DRAFT_2777 [Butyriboletus roseoflavus]